MGLSGGASRSVRYDEFCDSGLLQSQDSNSGGRPIGQTSGRAKTLQPHRGRQASFAKTSGESVL